MDKYTKMGHDKDKMKRKNSSKSISSFGSRNHREDVNVEKSNKSADAVVNEAKSPSLSDGLSHQTEETASLSNLDGQSNHSEASHSSSTSSRTKIPQSVIETLRYFA